MGSRGGTVKRELRRSQDVQGVGQRRTRVDEKVVAGFELGLIDRAGESCHTSGREDWGLWIVDKNIARLGGIWCGVREHTISFARVGAASAVQVQGKTFCRKGLRI